MLSGLQKALKSELDRIHRYCRTQGETIAAAESVTAGCVQLLLSTMPDAQHVFQGGVTTYNCAQKSIHLDIEPIFAESCNGVDREITVNMAARVCTLFRAQIGLGITGYATPDPEAGVERLFAWIAIVRQGKTLYSGQLVPRYQGVDAQWEYATGLIRKLADILDAL